VEAGHPPALIRRFWAAASGFWRGDTQVRAWSLALGLALVTLCQIAVQYRVNFWTRDIFDAVEQRNAPGLRHQALLLLPLTLATVALAVAAVYGRMSMQREWRAWLVNRLIGRWVKRGRAHSLNLISGDHQVPEGRITDDARIATDAPVDFVVGLFNACVSAATFIGILWVVGGALDVTVGTQTLHLPGFLVLSVITYSALVTLAMIVFTRHFTSVSESINQAEAELRYALTHVRENSERIALLGSEEEERQGLRRALGEVIGRWRRYCGQHLRVTIVSNSNMLVAGVLPVFLCMPRFLKGQMSLGEVTQAAAAFVQVQSSFNWLVDNFARFADWRASARRVGTLLASLDTLWRSEQDTGSDHITRCDAGGVALRLQDLAIAHDHGRVVLDATDIVIGLGERVRFVGDSDSGKVALLHALAGLSDAGEGRIGMGRGLQRFVLSQNPFVPLGPLRQVACYPTPADRVPDERLRALLAATGLSGFIDRLDEDVPWEQLLGDGERQRLGLVRACLAAPDILLVDEALSALDPERQRQLMAWLVEQLPRAAILNLTHREEPDALFERTLRFSVQALPDSAPFNPPAAG
jgi:putative ATP-binding cassette transporter